MRALILILGVLLVVAEMRCLYLRKDRETKNDQLIRSWNRFRQKLWPIKSAKGSETGGVVNDRPVFDEIGAITLIPVLIDLNKKDMLLKSEQMLLSQVYGNIWQIIEEESHRSTNAPVNPLLKTIYDLIKFLRAQNLYSSDTVHNTVQQVPRQGLHQLKIEKTNDEHPSQRLLNMAAVLIRAMVSSKRSSANHGPEQANQDTSRIRYPRSAPSPKLNFNLQLSNIPVRVKSGQHSSSQQDDFPVERVDALLQEFIEKKGTRSSVDYAENDEYQMEDYFRIDESSAEYVYDDQYQYDEISNSRRPYQAGYENGSFQDLLMLAARHQMQRHRPDGRRSNWFH